ncbi:MAG: SLC13 family permease, partial [Candidatus Thiodiazotropha sp.]
MRRPPSPQRTTSDAPKAQRPHPATLVALVTTLVGLYLLLLPPAALPGEQGRAAGLAIIAIGLWATARLPEHITALLFFLLAMLLGVAPPSVIFSGFAASALWMVFAGLVIALAFQSSGLSQRLARVIAHRLNGSYLTLIAGMLSIGLLLGFMMPSSMGRVVLLMPIVLGLADHLGFAPGSNGRTGLVLAASFGTFVPTFAILPSNVPNMVLLGASESLFDISPLYGEYLLLHFPVLGLLKSLLVVVLIALQYPDEPGPIRRERDAAVPFSLPERKMSGLLLMALLLWFTDFLHHVSPAWIALAAALFLLLPRVCLIDTRQFNSGINYGPLFFVAGVLGLGALIAHSGLGARLAGHLISLLPLAPDHNLVNFLSLSLTATVTGILTTGPGVPAVLTPLADHIATSAGLPIKTVLMTQVVGFSIILFLYQSPPLMVAMQLSGEKLRPAMKMLLQLA